MIKMIERVARALCEADGQQYDAGHFGTLRDCYRWEARIAIEAMREPTKGMVLAGIRSDADDFPHAVWRAMIDAALKSN
jgi:hypothetical protein